jgi:hypothetical protein
MTTARKAAERVAMQHGGCLRRVAWTASIDQRGDPIIHHLAPGQAKRPITLPCCFRSLKNAS